MRYLNNRNEFLETVKKSEFKIVNEAFDMSGSGPFGNDINWGDSLVGRLFNAIRRKIGIGANLGRIQFVIRRLKSEFDYLLETSMAGELTEEQKKQLAMILICKQIRALKIAIVDQKSYGSDESEAEDAFSQESIETREVTDANMTEIKDDAYLEEIETMALDVQDLIEQVTDEYGKIDDQDALMAALKELEDKVKEMRKNLKKEGEEGEKSEEGDKVVIREDVDGFESVIEILFEYHKMKQAGAEKSTESEKPAETEESPGAQVGGGTVPAEKDNVGTATNDSLNYVNHSFNVYKREVQKIYEELYMIKESYSPVEFELIMEGFWDAVKNAAKGVGQFLGQATQKGKDFVKNAISKGMELGNKVVELGKNLVSKVSNFVISAYEKIKSMPGEIYEWCKDKFSYIAAQCGEIWNQAKKKGGEWIENAKNTIRDIYLNISNKFEAIIQNFKNYYSNKTEDLKNWFLKKKEQFIEASKSLKASGIEILQTIGDRIVWLYNNIKKIGKHIMEIAIIAIVVPLYVAWSAATATFQWAKNILNSIWEKIKGLWKKYFGKESEESESQDGILKAVKAMYNSFIGVSGGKSDEMITDLQEYKKLSKEDKLTPKYGDAVERIFTNVRNSVGAAKESYLIKEDLLNILSNDKKIADGIVGVYKVSKTKPDGSFEGVSDGMKKALENFNKTILRLIENGITKTAPEAEVKKESALLRYDRFRKIFEAEGDNDPEKVTYKTQKGLLTTFWEDLFTSKIAKIIYTEEEYKKVAKELEKVTREDEEGIIRADSISYGIDPVIAILKCFNRAYKLHTFTVIPGGRSGGKVSRSVFAEYDCFGGAAGGASSGELSGTQGPYRNKRIFNSWENAVYDILGDRKYQSIFDPNTSLRVAGGVKKGAGANLRKMMTDLLDGETLYKSKGDFTKGEGGAQAAFLEKYFGKDVADEVIKKTGGAIAFGPTEGERKKEIEQVQNMADSAKSSAVKFDKTQFKIEKETDWIFSYVKVNCTMEAPGDKEEEDIKNEKEAKSRYFLVLEMDGASGYMYVAWTRKFGNFYKYISNDFKKRNVSVSTTGLNGQPETEVYLTKMKAAAWRKILTGGVVQLKGQKLDESKKEFGKQTSTATEYLWEQPEGGELKRYYMQDYLPKLEGAKGFEMDKVNKGLVPETT